MIKDYKIFTYPVSLNYNRIIFITINMPFCILCLFLLTTTSCHDEPQKCANDLSSGKMSMNINELNWEGGTYVLTTSVVGVVGAYYHKPSCRLEQSLSMRLPSKDGIFAFSNEIDSLGSKAVPTFYYQDEDLLLGRYGIPPNKENGVIEAHYNPTSRTITAEFSVTLYLLQNHELPLEHPDSLVIVNGQLDAQFPK